MTSAGGSDRTATKQDDGWLCMADSINYVSAAHRDLVIVSGSHGGDYSISKALSASPRGVLLNDAGVGRHGAGVRALERGEVAGVAVATISYLSARIGDAADMRRRGVVSHVNRQACAAGIVPGMACAEAIERLAMLASPIDVSSLAVEEHRREITLTPGAPALVCIDSASLIRASDAGRIVITGSHGGLINGDPAKAINIACAFAIFNDAGVGCDQAGIGRLAPLDARGIAAATVGHMSAEIGNAMSTLSDGVLSHVNHAAFALGARAGMPLIFFLENIHPMSAS